VCGGSSATWRSRPACFPCRYCGLNMDTQGGLYAMQMVQ
jgi:hypothetical protein